MPFLALLGGIYFLFAGITGKGKAYTSKIGTPLSPKEVKTVRITYIVVGAVILIIAVVSGIEMITEL